MSTRALTAATEAARKQVLAERARRQTNLSVGDTPIMIGGCSCGSGLQMSTPGACDDPRCDGGHCYDKIAAMLGCQLVPIGGSIIGLAEQTSNVLIPTPDNVDYFLPVRAQLESRDTTDPLIVRPSKLTAVSIGDVPQWCMHNTAPVDNTTGIWTDALDSNRGRGVPVNWGPFSISTLSKQLQLTIWNPAAAGAPAELNDVSLTIWGYCLEDLPKPLKCGVYPSADAVDRALRNMAA